MLPENLVYPAKIIKTHGIKGDVIVLFDKGIPENFEETELVFIEFDKRPVPFFLSPDSIIFRSHDTIILHLDDIDSEKDAAGLLGKMLGIREQQAISQQIVPDTNSLTGYSAIDENYGFLGIVDEILDMPQQSILRLLNDNKEVLIPLNTETYLGNNSQKKEIYLCVPEGLPEVYLS